MKSKVNDEFIIDTNRECYNNLGKLYTDGTGDFETLLDMGVWQEFPHHWTRGKIAKQFKFC